ncbi:BHLH domain-containing protein [Psidium guajava]|nr:BHLH domain-containing protein [Psidium guajava]
MSPRSNPDPSSPPATSDPRAASVVGVDRPADLEAVVGVVRPPRPGRARHPVRRQRPVRYVVPHYGVPEQGPTARRLLDLLALALAVAGALAEEAVVQRDRARPLHSRVGRHQLQARLVDRRCLGMREVGGGEERVEEEGGEEGEVEDGGGGHERVRREERERE